MRKSIACLPFMILLIASAASAGPIVDLKAIDGTGQVLDGIWFPVYGSLDNVAVGIYKVDIAGGGSYNGSYNAFCVEARETEASKWLKYELQDVVGDEFKAAAYLLGKYGDTSDNAVASHVQMAVWALTIPTWASNNPGYSADFQPYVTEAQNAVNAGFNATAYRLAVNNPYTDPDNGVDGTKGEDYQNLIIRVPEPGLILLLGLGILGVTGLRLLKKS